MKTQTLAITLALTSLFAFNALAQATPQGVVETIVEKARTLDDKQNYKSNTQTIESLVDFQKIAAKALENNNGKMNPAQKTQVTDLLKKILTKTVYPAAPEFFKDVQIQFRNASPNQSKITRVTSVVTKGNKRSTVDYWLEPVGSSYRVVDLAIEGESWVENVKMQFDEIIEKKGVNDLIARMKKRLNQIEQDQKKSG